MPGRLEGGQDGSTVITVTYGSARAATLMVMVAAKQCQPKINEFQTGGATAADEWVELVNPCTAAIDVTGWTLVYRAASNNGTDIVMKALSASIPAGEIKLFAGLDYAGLNDGRWDTGGTSGILGQAAGAVALRMGAKDVGPIADAVSYGGTSVAVGHPYTEGNPLPAMSNSRPAQRLPYDGRDGDDGMADFVTGSTGTPHASNM
jgi:hypothetical protein